MFLANSLREKLKKSYLENDSDYVDKPLFSYKEAPINPNVLVSFRPPESILPENLITTQQLQALDKKEWEQRFSLGKLRKDWKNKVNLEFDLKHKKFPDELVSPQVRESQKFVKELIDPDILELRQKYWNKSSETKEKIRPELKQTLFEVSHGLQDFKIVPLKEHTVEEGCDSRNNIIIRGNQWDISNNVERELIEDQNEIAQEKAVENSARYWRNNEYNRENGEPFPISEERKKVEVIRYFKKYRTPYQKVKDYYNTMKKVKELTALDRADIEKEVKYANPGYKNMERIDALVFKKMHNLYKYKYNELTGKLNKEEMKKRQNEENKFRWKDVDLVNKMIAVEQMDDPSWFTEFSNRNRRLCNSQDKLRRNLLKPLVIKGSDIHKQEEVIKEKLEEDYKKQKKRELLMSQKQFKKKTVDTGCTSRYPLDKEGLENLEKSLKNMDLELNKKNLGKSLPLINTLGNFTDDSAEVSPLFLDAYKKVCSDELEKANKRYSKDKNQISFEYIHPGTYREFEYEEKKVEKDPMIEGFTKEVKVKVKRKMWSCCMNQDENAKGCIRRPIRKYKWIYDP